MLNVLPLTGCEVEYLLNGSVNFEWWINWLNHCKHSNKGRCTFCRFCSVSQRRHNEPSPGYVRCCQRDGTFLIECNPGHICVHLSHVFFLMPSQVSRRLQWLICATVFCPYTLWWKRCGLVYPPWVSRIDHKEDPSAKLWTKKPNCVMFLCRCTLVFLEIKELERRKETVGLYMFACSFSL